MEPHGGNDDAVFTLSERFSSEHLQLLYQIGVVGKRDLHLAPDMRTGMEMTLLRMLAFEPGSSDGSDSSSVDDTAGSKQTSSEAGDKPNAKHGAVPVLSPIRQPAR